MATAESAAATADEEAEAAAAAEQQHSAISAEKAAETASGTESITAWQQLRGLQWRRRWRLQ